MIKSKKIEQIARKYLHSNIGNLVGPDIPVFDKKLNFWRVSILHHSKFGEFKIGEMKFTEGGEILDVPTRKEILELIEQKLSGNIVIRIEIKGEKIKPEEIQKIISSLPSEDITLTQI